MRQQVHGCLKGALVGRDLCPPNLWEPQGAPLQKFSDSLMIYFLGCRCYPDVIGVLVERLSLPIFSPESEH